VSTNVTTNYEQLLKEKAKTRTAVIGIVGLGYVGLPLAVEMAEAGYTVIGFDVSKRVVDIINAGTSHVQDIPSERLKGLVDRKKLSATADLARMSEPDCIIIAVPTPLSKTRDPDVSYIVAATDSVARSLRVGQAVVLESTTYPGTTRELMLPALEKGGLTVGKDFFLAFSPERVDPGNPKYHTRNTPKVLGGITPACTEVVAALYAPAIDTLVEVSSPEAAELVKLLENTFRSVNIGLVNEMAIVCDKLGVDVWEVINAAATKPFGFMKFTPGPGVGGHCIPLEPHYLAWKMRTLNYRTRFIELAGEINAEMPEFWVQKVVDSLNDASKSVRGSTVMVLGVAYKKDIDDVRESPALDIIRLLERMGAHVIYHDPFIAKVVEDDIELHSTPLTAENVRKTDCIVLVTDHTNIDYGMVAKEARALVDTRHIVADRAKKK
jgi:UDP-N-acetyl-D-glucosamine dehydrogenase